MNDDPLRIKVAGPPRPAGSPPLVWWQERAEGVWLRIQVGTPDFGTIYDATHPGGRWPVVAWMGWQAALESATEHGRN